MSSFGLGTIVWTPGAAEMLGDASKALKYIRRHVLNDWGDICKEDAALNDIAVKEGTRILSAYETDKGKLWVITEASREYTTLLLPSEY